MKITITYELHTDGDYSLRNYKNFGAKKTGDYTYEGMFSIEGSEFSVRMKARNFLEEFLCDGIHVSYTHHYLLMDFCLLIDSLIHGIYEYGEDVITEELGGNYDGTIFTIIKEESTVSM